MSIKSTLAVFNHENIKPEQLAIFSCILRKTDCMAVMPTGYGKSLPYQMLPVFAEKNPDALARYKHHSKPMIVVCSPLVALMMDQVKRLKDIGLRASFVGKSRECHCFIC